MFTKNMEISQGSLLLKEKPFVYTLSSKFRTERCDFCLSKKELLKCSICRYVYYCGRSCQKLAWSIHKLECQNLKLIAPRILPDAARLLARLVIILNKDGAVTKSYYTKRDFRTFKDLMSHYNDLKNDKSRLDHFTSLYHVLQDFFLNQFLPNTTEVMIMYGKMCVNSFSICDQELRSVGTGIYLAASIVNHSCEPNAVVTFEGTMLVMRSLKTLPHLDWSKIVISYIDLIAVKSERQKELETSYYFLCECSKCLAPEPLDEMTGAACPNPTCDNCININNTEIGQSCFKCGTVITAEFINAFHEIMEMTELHINNMKEVTFLDVCNVCLNKHEGYLYKNNVKHIKTLDLAFDSSIEFGKFDDAAKYGLQLIKGFYKYYGKIHPLTGLLHLKIGKLLLYKEQVRDALEHFKNAKEVLEITHGSESSICREQLYPMLQQTYLELQK